jgi:hypothetical protein
MRWGWSFVRICLLRLSLQQYLRIGALTGVSNKEAYTKFYVNPNGTISDYTGHMIVKEN